jgi:broad specificity phosphatase PhoE
LPDAADIWLIRHGETEWSLSGQHTGRTELDLTARGRAQATALRPVVASIAPALVLCSPRVRAQQTAELAGLHVDAIDPDLAEWDYGDYEGLTTAQIRERDPGWTIWTGKTPGGESEQDVTERVDRVLARVRLRLAAGPVVLIAHGHISRVIGARWVGLPARSGGIFALDTAATCVLSNEHDAPVVAHWNVVYPLGQENS